MALNRTCDCCGGPMPLSDEGIQPDTAVLKVLTGLEREPAQGLAAMMGGGAGATYKTYDICPDCSRCLVATFGFTRRMKQLAKEEVPSGVCESISDGDAGGMQEAPLPALPSRGDGPEPEGEVAAAD